MTKYFKNAFAIKGEKEIIADELQTTGEVSYEQGFGYDYQRKLGVDVLAKPVPREKTNQLYYDITSAIKQYQEHGFYEFITAELNGGKPFPYAMGACVRFDMSDAQDGSDVRNFASKRNNNTSSPKEDPDSWSEMGRQGSSAYLFTTITESTQLTIDQAGIILVDASAGDLTISLPSTELNIGYTIKRLDNTTNQAKIQTTGLDKLKYNLAINPNGYDFFYLFGAGDYWQVVSDGQGNWFDIDRLDKTPIGRVEFITSTTTPIGGYLLANGSLLNRADYPFLWDQAQQSEMLVDEADRVGMEGCFTKGDGVTTFRLPELRGEFLRVLDNERGIDINRILGSFQDYAIENITGEFAAIRRLNFDPTGAFKEKGKWGSYVANGGGDDWGSTYQFDSSEVCKTAEETRPRNIAYPAYIKII